MKMLIRLFWLILTQSFRPRVDLLGPAVTQLRVYPSDLDIFFHVNNGVYLTYADLGRTDLMLRSNVFNKIRKQGWYPVVAAETIQFRKSLTLGQRFTIKTHILGWDERSIYLEQRFEQGTSWVATAIIDARFLSKKGEKLTPSQVYELVGYDKPAPELPAYIHRWQEAVQLNRDAQEARPDEKRDQTDYANG